MENTVQKDGRQEGLDDGRQERLDALHKMERGGFIVRALASLIDTFIFVVIPLLIFLIYKILLGHELSAEMLFTKTSVERYFDILMSILYILYQVIFIYKKGATPGKIFFNLRVVDLETLRYPSLYKSTLRTFGTWLSSMILGFGFLMVAFRKDKRALHDLIANTVVVKLP